MLSTTSPIHTLVKHLETLTPPSAEGSPPVVEEDLEWTLDVPRTRHVLEFLADVVASAGVEDVGLEREEREM